MYREQNSFCVKKSKQRTGKFKTIILKVKCQNHHEKNTFMNVHGFNPKPAGSVDKATN
jgi:hypothetical protein